MSEMEKAAFIDTLTSLIPAKDSLAIVKAQAKIFIKTHSSDECRDMGLLCYQSENFQIQEVGVFLMAAAAREHPEALEFLHDEVSRHENWKVQEILAMAFDNHCRSIGYEKALPLIKAWQCDERPNVRRAASEGLRVWTSRPYFKDHPEEAINLLAALREDESDYVRRSAGNALKDISKKHGQLIRQELMTWDLTSKRTQQVYKLASKYLEKDE